ncbi:hypothetical protein [Neotabrizicola sp. VNH66]|uniref:hypothetical protein n=1 Tax=Neotabrizicola sp. VNH66 TaxID=3400918 RepID=UPI003C00406A
MRGRVAAVLLSVLAGVPPLSAEVAPAPAKIACPPTSPLDPLPDTRDTVIGQASVTTARFPGAWQQGLAGKAGYDFRLFVNGSGSLGADPHMMTWRVDFDCDLAKGTCSYRSIQSPPADAMAVAKALGECLTHKPPKPKETPEAPKDGAAKPDPKKPDGEKPGAAKPAVEKPAAEKPATPAPAKPPAATAEAPAKPADPKAGGTAPPASEKPAPATPPAAASAPAAPAKPAEPAKSPAKPADPKAGGTAPPASEKPAPAKPPAGTATVSEPAHTESGASPQPATGKPAAPPPASPAPDAAAKPAHTPAASGDPAAAGKTVPDKKPATGAPAGPAEPRPAAMSLFQDLPPLCLSLRPWPGLPFAELLAGVPANALSNVAAPLHLVLPVRLGDCPVAGSPQPSSQAGQSCYADHLPAEPAGSRTQRLLLLYGLDPGPIDGTFGPRTRTAVLWALGEASNKMAPDEINARLRDLVCRKAQAATP